MPHKPRPKYNCTQQELYSIGNTAWDNCSANLAAFTAYKAKYIAAFITGKKTAITTAAALPDDQTRQSPAEVARVQLIPLNDACLLDFQKLKGYIEDGFPKAEWKSRFEAAGQTYYDKASKNNWENTIGITNNMNAFIAANTAALTLGGMPAGFAATVTTDTTRFTNTYNLMKTSQETGVGTGSKITSNNAIYDDMILMFQDAKRIFPTDAEKQDLFTFATLRNMISPPGSASLKVTVQRPDNSVVPNVPVTIQSETGTPNTVNTDVTGVAQFDSIDPDRYAVTLNAATFQPVNVAKDVDTGTNARLTVKLVAI